MAVGRPAQQDNAPGPRDLRGLSRQKDMIAQLPFSILLSSLFYPSRSFRLRSFPLPFSPFPSLDPSRPDPGPLSVPLHIDSL